MNWTNWTAWQAIAKDDRAEGWRIRYRERHYNRVYITTYYLYKPTAQKTSHVTLTVLEDGTDILYEVRKLSVEDYGGVEPYVAKCMPLHRAMAVDPIWRPLKTGQIRWPQLKGVYA